MQRIKRYVARLARCSKKTAQRAYAQTVDEVIERYPRLFSEHRFSELAELFDPDAVIGIVERDRSSRTLPLRWFIKNQITYSRENKKYTEQWLDVKQSIYGNVAVIISEYALETDNGILRGYDVLSLAKGEDGWRIISLVYEERQREYRNSADSGG